MISNNDRCPTCNQVFDRIRQHICLREPNYHKVVYDFFQEHAKTRLGFIVSIQEYRGLVRGAGLPSAGRLEREFDGWTNVAIEFGVKPRREGKHPMENCEHCGGRFTYTQLVLHQPHCPKEQSIFARLSEFIYDISDGQKMPTQAEYAAIAQKRKANVPLVTDIISAWGTWKAFCDDFGMKVSMRPKVSMDNALLEMKKWMDNTEPPYLGKEWDGYARLNDLPTRSQIQSDTGFVWADLMEMMEEKPYPIRPSEEVLAATYRAPMKIRKEDKDRAERLCARIKDEVERAKKWFEELGLQQHYESLPL